MKPPPIKHRFDASTMITANLEFTDTGYLRAVYLNCQSDGDQAVLEKALDRLLRPGHIGWIKRLFRRGLD